ncbi:hypothetical protein [Undibacterium terreum]|uniref:Uncharacterized protein n=1 Tax=Undibacterium terreum TaxID=1224302 RepID=A0A916XH71_9BURK|nr:hypothetical protein [Undibacterium terreum]GGC73097.1 hypothetical protein GCM10011396_20320 [Undibacterium terreum]
MSISFKAEKKFSSLLDPRRQFDPAQIESEIRYDPLTQDTARICHFSGVVPQAEDMSALLESTRPHCPFCESQVGRITPKFTDEFLHGFGAQGTMVADGRLVRGEATLFPNLFPYDEISAIAAVSHAHAFDAKAMPSGLIAETIKLARDIFYPRKKKFGRIEDCVWLADLELSACIRWLPIASAYAGGLDAASRKPFGARVER